MNEVEFNELLEIATRRPLTAEERGRLESCCARDPALQEVRDEEMGLNRLIGGLSEAPLASNFTRQVLEAVEREPRTRSRGSGRRRWFGLPGPAWQAAAVGVVLLAASLGYGQYRAVERHKIALALSEVGPSLDVPSEAVALGPDEMWKNFDAIKRLGPAKPPPDEELLSVLNELAMK
jgi:hypothetical protein